MVYVGLPERQRAVGEISARLPDLTRSTIAVVQETIPAYRDLSADQLRDVSAIASWVLLRVPQLWAEQTEFDDHDLARFRAIGAARAEDGRPITAVLRAYRVAAIRATSELTDLGRRYLDFDDIAALPQTLLTALDELSEALNSGYTAARNRLTGDRDRALRELLDDLIIGRQSSPETLADRSNELGVSLPAHPVLLVAEPADPARSAGINTLAQLRDALIVPETADHLATLRGSRAVLLLPQPALPQIEVVLAGRAWRGCVIVRKQLNDVAAAYRLAADALDSAPAHAFRARPLLDDADAQVLALLRARPSADPTAVAGAVLGPLIEPAHQHLLDGLAGFLSSGSATGAAQQLHLHPQTLRYRLSRVRALTSRDPHDPWHRFTLDIAVQLAGGRDTE